MPLFRAEKVYLYDKSQDETFKDLKDALERIGKVQDFDIDSGKFKGKTRYGLQKVKIEATLEARDNQTEITFHGKSDDAQGEGARKGIERLFETMGNLDNPEFSPSKSGISIGQVLANILIIIIAFVIGFSIENQWISIIVLAVCVFLINYFFSITKITRK
ncbi:MAG: hypothetical protein U9R53_07155 [Chloroflexota bacterium]|nr:hypothetical protein [Chloroflexota bacterium]